MSNPSGETCKELPELSSKYSNPVPAALTLNLSPCLPIGSLSGPAAPCITVSPCVVNTPYGAPFTKTAH